MNVVILFLGFPGRKHQFSSWFSCSTMQFNRGLYSKNFNRVFSLEVVVTIISLLFRPVYAMVARKIGWACQLMTPNREFIFWLPMRKDHMHKNKNICFKIAWVKEFPKQEENDDLGWGFICITIITMSLHAAPYFVNP